MDNIDLSNTEEKIVKIGENNVEVHKVLYSKDGKTEIIVDRESYGQERIDREKEAANSKITYLNNLVINDEIVKEQAKLDKLDTIEAEMISVDVIAVEK
jgi:hypothetical protein